MPPQPIPRATGEQDAGDPRATPDPNWEGSPNCGTTYPITPPKAGVSLPTKNGWGGGATPGCLQTLVPPCPVEGHPVEGHPMGRPLTQAPPPPTATPGQHLLASSRV